MKLHWVAIGTGFLAFLLCTSQFGLDAAAPEATDFSAAPEPSIDALATGYVTASILDDPSCGQGDCDSQLSIRFHILASESDALHRFLAQVAGNAYAGPDFVALGCLEGGRIRYQNASDALGMKEFFLPAAVSSAILRATPASPVTLRLRKFPLSAPTNSPVCYAHFATVELAE